MFELSTLLLIALACFITSIISGIAGFGGGFIIIAVFLFFFETKEAIALSNIVFLWITFSKWFYFRKTVDWGFVGFVLVGAVPGVVLGLFLFDMFSVDWINTYLALLAGYIILQHFWKRLPSIKNFSSTKTFIAGFSWGLLSGIGTGGGLKGMILKWKGYSRHIFVGTSAAMSFLLVLVKTPLYYVGDYIQLEKAIPIFLIAGISTFAGSYIGKKMVDRISHTVFEYIVLSMLGIVIIRLLFF